MLNYLEINVTSKVKLLMSQDENYFNNTHLFTLTFISFSSFSVHCSSIRGTSKFHL